MRYGTAGKGKKALSAAVIFLAAALAVFLGWKAVEAIGRNIETGRNNRHTTQLVLESGLLARSDPQDTVFSCVQEPWIALFKSMKSGSEWHVIGCSLPGSLTQEDLARFNTWILCEGRSGSRADYDTYINGVKMSTSNVASEAVSIRCVDLKRGVRFGRRVTLGSKPLPKSKASTADILYSDSEVLKEVRLLAASQTCPGYADIWKTDAETGSVTGSSGTRGSDECVFVIPGNAKAIRSLGPIPGRADALYIPAGVAQIEDGALDKIFFVIADPGSYALRYAEEHGILYTENGSGILTVPQSLPVLNGSVFNRDNAWLKRLWEVSGVRAVSIPPETRVEGRLNDLQETGIKALVERDSPAEAYFLEQTYDYTYRDTWLKREAGGEPAAAAVTLGRYEQDGIAENGPEPIEWTVLHDDGETCLLVSRDLLGTWHTGRDRDLMDEEGILWLYEEFAPSAFTEEELQVIAGGSLQEKIGLPAARDVLGWWAAKEERSAAASAAAAAEDAIDTAWLLADEGRVCSYGEVRRMSSRSRVSIRPAIRVDRAALEALAPQEVTFAPPAAYERVRFGTRRDGTPIPWLVLERRGDRCLLLSAEAEEYITSFSNGLRREVWAESGMRSWLNGEFLEQRFTAEEREAVLETEIAHGGETGSVLFRAGWEPTADRVFLLSVSELKRYFPMPSGRILRDSRGEKQCWWLRSCLSEYVRLAVNQYGHLYGYTSTGTTEASLRPAMWVDAGKLDALQETEGR